MNWIVSGVFGVWWVATAPHDAFAFSWFNLILSVLTIPLAALAWRREGRPAFLRWLLVLTFSEHAVKTLRPDL
jgi:hypothetical protein